MKRVPYKINHCEEGDMFEEFSCSSDFDKVQPIHGVGKGLLADPKKPTTDTAIHDIFNMTKHSGVTSTAEPKASKEERIR